nr:unnamed protein product [Haemonchus contortus]
MEALENSFVQLLIDSDEETDNEDVTGAHDGLLADTVESSDDEDSEEESDAGRSSTIVQPSVEPFNEDSGIQNDDVHAFSNPMSFYKLFMTDSVRFMINIMVYGRSIFPQLLKSQADMLFSMFENIYLQTLTSIASLRKQKFECEVRASPCDARGHAGKYMRASPCDALGTQCVNSIVNDTYQSLLSELT